MLALKHANCVLCGWPLRYKSVSRSTDQGVVHSIYSYSPPGSVSDRSWAHFVRARSNTFLNPLLPSVAVEETAALSSLSLAQRTIAVKRYHLYLWVIITQQTAENNPMPLNTGTSNVSSSIATDNLPSKTLHLVCEHLQHDPNTQKHLRLVSKEFNKVQ